MYRPPSTNPARVAWAKSGNVTSADLRRIWNASKGCCHYCGEKVKRCSLYPSTMRGFDHVKPRRAGGTNTAENLVVCCYACNLTKGNQYPYDPNTPRNKAKRLSLADFTPRWLGRKGPNTGVPISVQRDPNKPRRVPVVRVPKPKKLSYRAQLLASHTELLQACKAMFDLFHSQYSTSPEATDALNAAKLAIAKGGAL